MTAPIKDTTDATFMADVIDASMQTPVIVDFWAPWCGPCKQLGPVLEKLVTAQNGKVKMVKINVDEQQAVAAQLRVQSIPTVYAFVGGRPVDGFMGAKPESELKAFVEKLLAAAGGGEDGEPTVEQALELAAQSESQGDITSALEAYSFVLEKDAGNLKAIVGVAKLYIKVGQAEQAKQFLAMAPDDCKDADILGLRAALELAEGAPTDVEGLSAALNADPENTKIAYDLARALAATGQMQGAIDTLLALIAKCDDPDKEQARQYLFKIFAALGHSSELTKAGRRKLSSMIFS